MRGGPALNQHCPTHISMLKCPSGAGNDPAQALRCQGARPLKAARPCFSASGPDFCNQVGLELHIPEQDVGNCVPPTGYPCLPNRASTAIGNVFWRGSIGFGRTKSVVECDQVVARETRPLMAQGQRDESLAHLVLDTSSFPQNRKPAPMHQTVANTSRSPGNAQWRNYFGSASTSTRFRTRKWPTQASAISFSQ